jgi:Rrf2 family protein
VLFTKKSEYALMAISIIAKNNKPKNAQDISSALNIQKPFLSKVLQSLVLSNILMSKKGVNGGFLLAKNPKNITMLDVVNCVEDNNISVFACSSSMNSCIRDIGPNCTIWKSLNLLQKHIEVFLSSLSLYEILDDEHYDKNIAFLKNKINLLKQ